MRVFLGFFLQERGGSYWGVTFACFIFTERRGVAQLAQFSSSLWSLKLRVVHLSTRVVPLSVYFVILWGR